MLETDIQKEVDLDREVKASGILAQEDEEIIQKISQQLLENAGTPGDNETGDKSDSEELEDEQFEVDPEMAEEIKRVNEASNLDELLG